MSRRVHLALVCSSGGHLYELHRLREAFCAHSRFWVTFPTEDARILLEGEPVYPAYYPTNRSLINLLRNLVLAVRILRRERPTHLITTGAGVAVPFIYLGKLWGVRTIFVESLARVENLSLSGRMVYPVVDHFLVQWEEAVGKYRRAVYGGRVI